MISENWVVYSFWNIKAKRTEVGVLSLYEGMMGPYDLNPFKVTQSLTYSLTHLLTDLLTSLLSRQLLTKSVIQQNVTRNAGRGWERTLVLCAIKSLIDRWIVCSPYVFLSGSVHQSMNGFINECMTQLLNDSGADPGSSFLVVQRQAARGDAAHLHLPARRQVGVGDGDGERHRDKEPPPRARVGPGRHAAQEAARAPAPLFGTIQGR